MKEDRRYYGDNTEYIFEGGASAHSGSIDPRHREYHSVDGDTVTTHPGSGESPFPNNGQVIISEEP